MKSSPSTLLAYVREKDAINQKIAALKTLFRYLTMEEDCKQHLLELCFYF